MNRKFIAVEVKNNPLLSIYGANGILQLFNLIIEDQSPLHKFTGTSVFRWRTAAPTLCCVEQLFAYIDLNRDYYAKKKVGKDGTVQGLDKDDVVVKDLNTTTRHQLLNGVQYKFVCDGEEFIDPLLIRYAFQSSDNNPVSKECIKQIEYALFLMQSHAEDLENTGLNVKVHYDEMDKKTNAAMKSSAPKESFKPLSVNFGDASSCVLPNNRPMGNFESVLPHDYKKKGSDFVSVSKACTFFGVTQHTFYSWAAAGLIKIYKNPFNRYCFCKREDMRILREKFVTNGKKVS